MLDNWRKRRQLRRSIQALYQAYKLDLEGGEDLNEFRYEIGFYEPELRYLETRQLVDKACKLGIEDLIQDDEWFYAERSPNRSYNVLTDEGERKLRHLIYNKRRENIEWWIKTVIPAITGLIGAITGLVAVLNR